MQDRDCTPTVYGLLLFRWRCALQAKSRNSLSRTSSIESFSGNVEHRSPTVFSSMLGQRDARPPKQGNT
ncbi:hypothetical protein CC86DRAFT_370924 [Ophiobolus disseminans]|uniref:Uncharacterized protein n=1 Tax=Ophiobolus disseminans TaxID=1469910 RepID=A0A6A6ZVW9_9PLEO|nr:hypothetical protein CC86DRAFT_370924 [Ophiobolus disseminans]